MPASSDEDWVDEYPEPYDEPPGDEDFEHESAHRVEGATRTPARSAAVVATGDLAGAKKALVRARDALEAAEGGVADLEGRVVVLEVKCAAVEADDGKEAWQQAAAREELAKAQRAARRAGTKLTRAQATRETADAQVKAEVLAMLTGVVIAEAEAEPAEPRFATVDLFVELFVLPNYIHKYAEQRVRWCQSWWEHAEAITRLEAIWEAFEVMRLQPAPSFSTWLRDHFDVHMGVLTMPDGVFYNCDSKKSFHEPQQPWPTAAAPEGMFATIETAQIQRALTAAAIGPVPVSTAPDGDSGLGFSSATAAKSTTGAAAGPVVGPGAVSPNTAANNRTSSGASR